MLVTPCPCFICRISCSRLHVPDADRMVVDPPGHEPAAVAAEGKRPDTARVPPKRRQLIARLQIAETDRVAADIRGMALIGREGNSAESSLLASDGT